jgi:hypothetical protein
MTFGRDLGGNATQIRQRAGFILAWNRDLGQFRASPAAAPWSPSAPSGDLATGDFGDPESDVNSATFRTI